LPRAEVEFTSESEPERLASAPEVPPPVIHVEFVSDERILARIGFHELRAG